MWWREMGLGRVRIALALLCAGLVGGCFQPLYGQRSTAGGPSIVSQLSAVEVQPIDAANGTPEARLGVEVRNALIYDLTGGSGGTSPTHRLKIQLSASRQQVIVDITTARPDVENYGIDATYTLVELATGKVVVTGRTFSRVSYDIPGQQQRFARQRGLRDAENRAASVIAENIKSRLASYFVTGG
ncbi:MAG: LPS assembly lipoprotein LptE [Pseudorhodoplanes sp.]|jgi:LPS-assembly lipoprotein|nr:LPS assembly lipoprotein LptE [Pseudorhodoplanes sp.]